MVDFSVAIDLINSAKNVALFTHIRPDGDAIGSTLALRRYLLQRGKNVGIFCESDVPKKFLFLDGATEFKSEITGEMGEFDLFVAIDTASLDRLGVLGKVFARHKNTLVIDHHVSNTRFAKVCVVSSDAACAETMFALLSCAGATIDKEIATMLFTGLVTDTGSFSQANTTVDSLKVGASLADSGIDFSAVALRVYKQTSKAKFDLERRVLNSVRFFEQDKIALITITKKDLSDTNTTIADTEGLVNAVLYVEGVVGSISIVEAKGGHKVSFRSKGDIDVNRVAGTFGGGGHKNAAGCMINAPLEEVVEKAVRALSLELL